MTQFVNFDCHYRHNCYIIVVIIVMSSFVAAIMLSVLLAVPVRFLVLRSFVRDALAIVSQESSVSGIESVRDV
jgi:hypothetical protein